MRISISRANDYWVLFQENGNKIQLNQDLKSTDIDLDKMTLFDLTVLFNSVRSKRVTVDDPVELYKKIVSVTQDKNNRVRELTLINESPVSDHEHTLEEVIKLNAKEFKKAVKDYHPSKFYQLVKLEKKDRNRKGIISFLEKKISVDRASRIQEAKKNFRDDESDGLETNALAKTLVGDVQTEDVHVEYIPKADIAE